MQQLELEQQIRFALSRLSDTSAHHEFEQLCLAFARRRISLNLLPATGPVSAGGDQGRDAESFWSYLGHEAGATTTSAALAAVGTDRVVLACTLQATGLTRKVRSDLALIVGSGSSVDRVFYFMNSALPVARRHELVQIAADEYRISLDIIDLQALSTHLADPDLYWIASAYLRLPSDAAPTVSADASLPNWYRQLRSRWLRPVTPPMTAGDLSEVRLLARVATQVPAARADLPMALALLDTLAESTAEDIAWHAGYERCVATYRGAEQFAPIEAWLRSLIETASQRPVDGSVLVDAVSLLNYGFGAYARSRGDSTAGEWSALRNRLLSRVEQDLATAASPNLRALLLSVRMRLCFMVVLPEQSELASVSVLPEYGRSRDAVLPEPVQLIDVDGGMAAALDLLAVFPQAPMFPMTAVAEMLDMLTLTLLTHPSYAAVRAGVEDAVARVSGASSAGERALQRAMVLGDAGRWVAAASEAQAAARSFWTAHDVGAASRCMLVEGDVLRMAGLHIAAKTRYLAAAYASGAHADADVRTISAEALLRGAQQDYFLGRWATAALELQTALQQHVQLAPNAADVEAHEYLADAAQLLTNILGVATAAPSLATWLHAELGIDVAETEPPSRDEVRQVFEQVAAAGLQPPFSDLHDRLHVAWRAFGVTWRFEFDSDPTTVMAADRTISALQFLLLSLDGQPVEWLPTTVRVLVQVGGAPRQTRIHETPPSVETELRFEIRVAAVDAADADPRTRLTQLFGQAHRTAVRLVAATSLQPPDDLFEILTTLGTAGALASPAVRAYDDTARVVVPVWAAPPRAALADGVPHQDHEGIPESGLPELTGNSPRLRVPQVERAISDRYAAVGPLLRVSLRRILDHAQSQELLREARARGVLDWQLLSALVNLVGTWRVEEAGLDLSDDEGGAAAETLMRSPEPDDSTGFPPTLLSPRALTSALQVLMVAVLPSYGLQLPGKYVDFAALEAVLRQRFGYGSIDQLHNDVFGWS